MLCERLLKFRRCRPLLGFLCLVYASQGETDKKRRAGRPAEFLDSLSVGGPRRGDEWYARTGGPRSRGAGGRGERKREEKRRAKRDPTGPTSATSRRRGPRRVETVGVL